LDFQTRGRAGPDAKLFSFASKLVLCFGLICVILAGIDAFFFFSLRSIEKLNAAERASDLGEITRLHRLADEVGQQQAEVSRYFESNDPGAQARHEQVFARLAQVAAKGLKAYKSLVVGKAKERLYAQLIQAQRVYSARTEELLGLSRAHRDAEATAFTFAAQVPAYDRYQVALGAMLHFEENERRDVAAIATDRIQQARLVGNVLIACAILIVLGTGTIILRLVRSLRQDKRSLQSEVAEHEQMAQALRDGEARYRVLVDYSPDGILVVCEGKIVFVNPAALALLQADRADQLLGRDPSLIVHPEERAAVASRIREIAAGERPSTTERRMLRIDGSIIEVESTATSFLYEGRPALQVTIRDNTQRKASERELREAEEKYRSIFDNALEGIFRSTPDGVLLAANPALARMLGFESPAQLIRERTRIAQQGYAQPELRQEFKRLIAEKGVVNAFECEVKRKNGHTIWISENARLVRDANGEPRYYEGSMQDITERKHSEEELRRSVERFQAFTKATAQIVWQTDPVGHVLEDLPSWRAYTGQTLAQMLGSGWIDCIHPEDRDEVRSRWLECIENKSLFESEYRIRGATGVYRLFLARGVPVLDAAGGIREWVGTDTDITAPKRAAEVLRESERRLRFLNDLGEASRSLAQPKEIMAAIARLLGVHLQVSHCAYAEVEEDGDHFNVPDEYAASGTPATGQFRLSQFGAKTHTEMVAGRTLVLCDFDAEPSYADGIEAYRTMETKAMIACPLIKDGRLRAMMAVQSATPRQWTDGEIALVQEVAERCSSIIERARAELILRTSEEQLRLVIAGSNDGIFEHDYGTGVLTWSDRTYEMLGLDRHSFHLTFESFTALIHPDERATFSEAVREQMASGGRYESPLRIHRHDGSYGHFLTRGRVVLDPAGKPLRIIGSITDLTTLLHAEQKLVEQAHLLDLARDAIIVRDMDDRVEFWNQGAELLYGWTAAETQGRMIAAFLHNEKPSDVLAAQRTLLQTGVWSGECRHLTKQGSTIIVSSRWSLVRDEHGEPKSTLVINTDITEQKKFEDQFLRAQRLESIGTLASGVAHDLNNILLPIMMAAPILREELNDVERDRFLDIVESSARRGADIIKQVLTFARGADGDRVLLQPIYFLEEISKIAGKTFPKSITLRTHYEENIRALEANPTQLHQVLLNLCINARDAMPNGGEITLSAENFDVDENYANRVLGATAGPHVLLQVTDNGVGIPSDVIPKIFDPFFTTKGVGEGTGLGLSTVAGIVKGHGGFVNVQSEPGHTTFKIYLPAKNAADAFVPVLEDELIPRGHNETILLVDDETIICEVAQLILENHGYQVLTAEDGPTALALFAQQMGGIAVVVTDLAMPTMDGLMLVRSLRRIQPDLKIVVSTGRAEQSRSAELALLAVDGFLTKPYTTRSLLLKLDHILHGGMQDAA
jgi:PAS domain S-box-containing protein